MRRRLLTIFCITVLISLSATTAFAGALHITGGVRFASSDLNAVGKIAGLGGLGLHEVKVVLEGAGKCGHVPFTRDGHQIVSISKGAVDFNVTTDHAPCSDPKWTSATITVWDNDNVLAQETYTCKTSNHSGTTCKRD